MNNKSPFDLGWLRSSRKQRILVADDDENTRLLYSMVLSRAGYDVGNAADGEEAWAALGCVHYDLLLTDHHMPRLTGLELVARMRDARMDLPVIVSSGCASLGNAAEYPQLGLIAIVKKSSDFTELLEIVKTHFEKASVREDGLYKEPLIPEGIPSSLWLRGIYQPRTHGWLHAPTKSHG